MRVFMRAYCVNFQAFSKQVLEQKFHHPGVRDGEHLRRDDQLSRPVRGGLSATAQKMVRAMGTRSIRERLTSPGAAQSREGEQAVDEPRHMLRGLTQMPDVGACSSGGKVIGAILDQRLTESVNAPQWRPQVMGHRITECFKLLVRRVGRGIGAAQSAFRPGALGDFETQHLVGLFDVLSLGVEIFEYVENRALDLAQTALLLGGILKNVEKSLLHVFETDLPVRGIVEDVDHGAWGTGASVALPLERRSVIGRTPMSPKNPSAFAKALWIMPPSCFAHRNRLSRPRYSGFHAGSQSGIVTRSKSDATHRRSLLQFLDFPFLSSIMRSSRPTPGQLLEPFKVSQPVQFLAPLFGDLRLRAPLRRDVARGGEHPGSTLPCGVPVNRRVVQCTSVRAWFRPQIVSGSIDDASPRRRPAGSPRAPSPAR